MFGITGPLGKVSPVACVPSQSKDAKILKAFPSHDGIIVRCHRVLSTAGLINIEFRHHITREHVLFYFEKISMQMWYQLYFRKIRINISIVIVIVIGVVVTVTIKIMTVIMTIMTSPTLPIMIMITTIKHDHWYLWPLLLTWFNFNPSMDK